MSCYGNYCTRQYEPFLQREELPKTYTRTSRYGESFASSDLRPNFPGRVSYFQSQKDLNDQSKQFLPSLNGSQYEHFRDRSGSPCVCDCHSEYDDCLCSCHSPNHRVYLYHPVYEPMTSEKDTGVTDELSELRMENQRLKDQLNSTRREKEYADAYINELQRDLSNRRVMAYQNKGKRASSVAPNKPEGYMLNRSFDVLGLVGEVANQDSEKPETQVRGGPEYYYEKIPDYNSLINSQKKFLESLKKDGSPNEEKRHNRESDKSEVYMTDPQNLSNSDLRALSKAENSQGFENSKSEIYGKYTPDIVERPNRFSQSSVDNEEPKPKENIAKKSMKAPKSQTIKGQSTDSKNLVPSFQGNPPNNQRGKPNPINNGKIKPSYQGRAGQINQRTKEILNNPNNGVQQINKDIDNYKKLFNGTGNSGYGYRPGITNLDPNRQYTYVVGNYDRYGNNIPRANRDPNDEADYDQDENGPFDIEQNGQYESNDPYESTNNPFPNFYATSDGFSREDGTRIPGSNFGPGGNNYYTDDQANYPRSNDDEILRGQNDEEEDPDMYNTDGGKIGGVAKGDPRFNVPKNIEICDEKGRPLISEGKEIKGIELVPYLDEKGKTVMDDNDLILFLGPDGRGVSQNNLEPIFTDKGEVLVNKDNFAILGIDNRPLYDKGDLPITETEPVDENYGKEEPVPKVVVMTREEWNKKNNKGPNKKGGNLVYYLNGMPVIDSKTGANIKPEELDLKLDKDGKPEKDSEGNIKVLGPDGKQIVDVNAFPLLDSEGKPIKEDGKYVFVNNMGQRLDGKDGSKTSSQNGSKRGTPKSQQGGSKKPKKKTNPYKALQIENLLKNFGIHPLLDEAGKAMKDEKGKPIFVDPNGKQVLNLGVVPVLDKDGRPKVNENGEMELKEDDEDDKIPYSPKVDNQGNPVYDKDGNPIILDKDGKEVKRTGLKPIVDKKGKPIKIDGAYIFVDDKGLDVKPALDNKGKVIPGKDGKPKVLVNDKVVSNLGILPKVDEDNKPVVDEKGDYVFEKDPDYSKKNIKVKVDTSPEKKDENKPSKGGKGGKGGKGDKSDKGGEEASKKGSPVFDKSKDIGDWEMYDKDGNPIYKPDGTPLLFKEITPFIKSNGQVKRDSDGKPMILGPDGKPLKKELNISLYVDLEDKPLKKGKYYVFLDKDGKPINPIEEENQVPEKDEKIEDDDDDDEEPLVNLKGEIVRDKKGNPVKPSELKPLIGNNKKPIKDPKGDPVLLDKYNKPVKDIAITILLDDEGYPVKDDDGNYILIDKATGERIPVHKKKKAKDPNANKEKYAPVKDYTPKVYGVQKHRNQKPSIKTSIEPLPFSTKRLCQEHGGLGPEYYLTGKIGQSTPLNPCEACKMDMGHSRSGYSIMNFNPYKINERRKDVAEYIPEYYLLKTYNEYDKNRKNYFNTLKNEFDASRERKISKTKVDRNYYIGTLNDSQLKENCFACEFGVANSLSGYSPMTFSPFNRREKRLKLNFTPEKLKRTNKSRATSIEFYRNSMNTSKFKNAVGSTNNTLSKVSKVKRKGKNTRTITTYKYPKTGFKSNGAYYNIVTVKSKKK